ncbi:MAG: DNA-binding response regulator [Candidatus Dadabacteria bacterium]|nr:MAG: DNA-binding response regulator [Candidatus Dadabacteria bacterium]
MQETVLVIEDDPKISRLVSMHLTDHGFKVDTATNGSHGLEKAQKGNYVLIVLDIMLPGLNGLEVCKRIRAKDNRVPILMLTCKNDTRDIVLGLELGADDYLTKPFKVEELVARAKALVRRAAKTQNSNIPPREELIFEDLVINLPKRRVSRRGKIVSLTAKQFDLLSFLALNPGRPFSRKELLNYVWGYENTGYEHTVDTHINRLRAQIEPEPSAPRYILTVWGVGYRFVEQDEIKLSDDE